MSTGEIVWHIFAIIGALKIFCVLLPWIYFKLFQKLNLDNYKYGYVLITGSTDGIGKSLTKEFLRRGFKVLMISRSTSKLQAVQQEMKAEFPESVVDFIASDFSFSHRNPVEFYEDLHSKIKEFHISVLVNNVGVADVRMLNSQPYEEIEKMLGVNVYPSTMLSHMLIPVFLKRSKISQQRSLIIDFTSTAEETIFAGSPVYSATKRYNYFISEGLRYEYTQIDFASVKPGPVTTQLVLMNKMEGVPLQCDSDTYAKSLLNGIRSGVNHGHWKSKVIGSLAIMPYLLNIGFVRLFIKSAVKSGLIR